ncbi:MAG TPA: hypothetical protein VFX96_10495 [Pyrinomonadaceae bacterium]|nr:hypothetical protein [Pyrinomonadaceae bacterium]
MSTNESNITRPTLETILERINSLEERLNGRMDSLEERLDNRIHSLEERMNARFDELDIKIDRVGSVAYTTHGEMLELRADFRELNKRLQEHFPALS